MGKTTKKMGLDIEREKRMKQLRRLYNGDSESSIYHYAKQMLGKSLRGVHGSISDGAGKGALGIAVEEEHFGYKRNSKSEPDFEKAGLELKCSSLKRLKDESLVSKDKLVLNIINFVKEKKVPDFYKGSFWKKNKKLLLMFYLYDKNVNYLDRVFKLIRTWDFSERELDLKIIKDDWLIIQNKIKSSQAQTLSESDTFFLSASMKGSKSGAEMRKQSGSKIPAQQRAYTLKSCYLNTIIMDSLNDPSLCAGLGLSEKKRKSIIAKYAEVESAVKDLKEYQGDKTFDDVIVEKFSKYYGKTVSEIESEMDCSFGKGKALAFNASRKILGIAKYPKTGFETKEFVMKTVRLELDGTVNEHMSFPNIDYKKIISETWEESDMCDLLKRRFLIVVYRKAENGKEKYVDNASLSRKAVLKKAFFWGMPDSDLNEVEKVWNDTKTKVNNGDYDNFVKSSENPVCHVRPKARNAKDSIEGPQGYQVKKNCFWLNREYVMKKMMKQ